MSSQACPYCGTQCNASDLLCVECGYQFVKKEPKKSVELTDEQIASLAGFAEASLGQRERGNARKATGLEKMGKWVLMWVILPSVATFVLQKLHILPAVNLGGLMPSSKAAMDAKAISEGRDPDLRTGNPN